MLNFLGWLLWRAGRFALGMVMIVMAVFVVVASTPALMYVNGNSIFEFLAAGVVVAFGPDAK